MVYNKPPEPSYTHAGMLMALGITGKYLFFSVRVVGYFVHLPPAFSAGHLNCLAATDLYRYLSQEHDATIIGVLLGMAASKR